MSRHANRVENGNLAKFGSASRPVSLRANQGSAWNGRQFGPLHGSPDFYAPGPVFCCARMPGFLRFRFGLDTAFRRHREHAILKFP